MLSRAGLHKFLQLRETPDSSGVAGLLVSEHRLAAPQSVSIAFAQTLGAVAQCCWIRHCSSPRLLDRAGNGSNGLDGEDSAGRRPLSFVQAAVQS